MEEKDEDLIRKFINGGFPGQGRQGVSSVYAQSAALYAIKQLQDEIDRYSTPPSHSFDDTLIHSTPPKDDTYKLTKERGYFIYWLMMHFAFLEDKGFNSQYKDIFNNIPAWSRRIITERKYNEYDRAFLKEVTEWLSNSDWVYKKPDLNEYNDYHTILESLQSN